MDKINELLTRGVDTIYPTKEELEKLLRSGKKLRIYHGIDPTGFQLHLGHMVGLLKMKQWQNLGHHVIFLIGDFTAMIGDPSGKSTTRKVLTHEEVLENAKTYKEQAGKILDFDGKNPVEIRFNGEWLGKMSAIEFFKLSKLLTFNQVIERDMFQERQKQGQDVYINELLYPVMQAYDSVALEVDLEIGGTDQTFNMLMGRKLMRQILQKEKFVMTTPLLTDSQGKKIGKTEGNVIALTDTHQDLFAKIMALGDDVIVKGFEYLTSVPLEEVKRIETEIKKGENPMKYKKQLAFEIVKELNNEEKANEAKETFERTVQKKEMPTDINEISLPKVFVSNATIITGIVELGLASSNAEAKRVIEQGGITINNERITSPNAPLSSFLIEEENIVQRGKQKIIKVKVI